MVIESGIAGKELSLGELDQILQNAGFVRWAWDYQHATYDMKYEDKSSKTTYYLRISGSVVEGRSEDHDAILKLEEPHIGKHLFPHGVDYDAAIPSSVQDTAKKTLAAIKNQLG